ncbi:MAG: N-acetylmuramoyl-L-alanine amidase [Salinibacter sp.]|uniref:N-acetylmuramoyl-L-alanine amidase n=1 Tax=Salinibacter sp. TaxID=2065818 RepID=UPI0035D403BE
MDYVCTAVPLCAEGGRNGFGIRGRHLWMGAALLLLMAAPVQAKVLVMDVSFAPRSDGEGYVVRAHTTQEPEGYFFSQSDSGQKLTWILYNAALHEEYQHSAPKGPVKRYTTTRRNGHLVLQIYLAENHSVSPTAYRDGASTDLLLNLTYEGSVPVADASSPSPGTGSVDEAGSADPISRASRKRSRLDTVVIDPGHGGKDPGAMAHGLKEKNIVLDVAHRLGDYIENRLDLEVAYTRTDDRFIALEDRGHFANRVGGDLFISLHVNAAPSAAVQGTETYFLGRSKTDAARRVMRRENSVVRQYEKNPDRYKEYDSEAFVRGELFLSASMQFSEEFAKRVQKQFKRRVERRSRGVKQAGFYVLWSASMPSVLVELGFLTNREEARYLNSDRGQTELAKALFRAIKSYEDEYNKGVVARE